MIKVSCNCNICAGEFNNFEPKNKVLAQINATNFKVCQACFDSSDPAEDYKQVREIVDNYIKFSQAQIVFKEIKTFLNSIN